MREGAKQAIRIPIRILALGALANERRGELNGIALCKRGAMASDGATLVRVTRDLPIGDIPDRTLIPGDVVPLVLGIADDMGLFDPCHPVDLVFAGVEIEATLSGSRGRLGHVTAPKSAANFPVNVPGKPWPDATAPGVSYAFSVGRLFAALRVLVELGVGNVDLHAWPAKEGVARPLYFVGDTNWAERVEALIAPMTARDGGLVPKYVPPERWDESS